jgi:hypothetical protein
MRRTLAAPVFGILMLATMVVATTSAALADPRDFTFENASDVTITHVYVSASDVMSWEEDILGFDVLPPGRTVDITFSSFTPGACSYDIKVVAADGREGYLWAVDLCAVSLVTFS